MEEMSMRKAKIAGHCISPPILGGFSGACIGPDCDKVAGYPSNVSCACTAI